MLSHVAFNSKNTTKKRDRHFYFYLLKKFEVFLLISFFLRFYLKLIMITYMENHSQFCNWSIISKF